MIITTLKIVEYQYKTEIRYITRLEIVRNKNAYWILASSISQYTKYKLNERRIETKDTNRLNMSLLFLILTLYIFGLKGFKMC